MLFEVTTYAFAKTYTDTAVAAAGGGTEIIVTDVSGQISPEGIEKLKESKNTVITLDNKVYRLSRIEGDDYKYISCITQGVGQVISMTELNIDQNTGYFWTKELIIEGSSVEYLEERLNAHIANNDVHISTSERNYWNNKVSIETRQIVDEKYDLKFKK